MNTDGERREEDRRRAQAPFDGPERRIAERRVPSGGPEGRPAVVMLSDMDLSRAWQRCGPDDPSRESLRAEIERRGLDI